MQSDSESDWSESTSASGGSTAPSDFEWAPLQGNPETLRAPLHCDPETLREADRKFILATKHLHDHREDFSMANIVEDITGLDSAALELDEYFWSMHAQYVNLHLTITPDVSESRDVCWSNVNPGGTHGKLLRRLAKAYRPKGVNLKLTIVQGMLPHHDFMYEFYGESRMEIVLRANVAVDLMKFSSAHLNFFHYNFVSDWSLRMPLSSLTNLLNRSRGPVVLLHNVRSPSPGIRTLDGPDTDALTSLQTIVSTVWTQASSKILPLRLWLQVGLTGAQTNEIHTYCSTQWPSASFHGDTTVLNTLVGGETMTFRSSTQKVLITTHSDHEVEIVVKRNKNPRYNTNPVRKKRSGRKVPKPHPFLAQAMDVIPQAMDVIPQVL